MEIYDKKLKQPSRELRKNLTAAEKLLWSRIRSRQLNNCLFYRQKPLGGYIVDFYCPKARLVIEVDGNQHHSREAADYDMVRDEYLTSMNLTVMRFSNRQIIRDIETVIQVITNHLKV